MGPIDRMRMICNKYRDRKIKQCAYSQHDITEKRNMLYGVTDKSC